MGTHQHTHEHTHKHMYGHKHKCMPTHANTHARTHASTTTNARRHTDIHPTHTLKCDKQTELAGRLPVIVRVVVVYRSSGQQTSACNLDTEDLPSLTGTKTTQTGNQFPAHPPPHSLLLSSTKVTRHSCLLPTVHTFFSSLTFRNEVHFSRQPLINLHTHASATSVLPACKINSLV